MNRLFGKSKPAEPAPSMSDITANLDKRVEYYETQIKKLNAELVEYRNQKMKRRTNEPLPQRIKNKLQQKKHYEQQRDNLMQQSFNLDQANYTAQMLIDTKGTVDAMKASVTQMKKEYKNIKIDEIEDLQDDMEDMMADANEIQDALGRTYGVPDIDESELEAEFAALGDELELEGDNNLFDDVATSIPTSVPATAPKESRPEPTAVASSSGIKLGADPAASSTELKDPIKEPW